MIYAFPRLAHRPRATASRLTALAAMLALPLMAPTTARAQDTLAGCRAIADRDARLTCYDRLADQAVRHPGAATTAPAPVPAPTVPGATSAAAAPAAVPQSEVNPEAEFGLPADRRGKELDALESSIPGPVNGWNASTRFTLANGQVWRVSDGSHADLDLQSPKVRIERGILGSFYLRIDGTNRSPRVQRVR